MKTEEMIKAKIEWLDKAIDNEENNNKIMQAKLWSALDTLKWVLEG